VNADDYLAGFENKWEAEKYSGGYQKNDIKNQGRFTK
jgi:hypothetical protein